MAGITLTKVRVTSPTGETPEQDRLVLRPLFYVGIVLAAVGLVTAVVGIVKLVSSGRRQAETDARLESVRMQLEQAP